MDEVTRMALEQAWDDGYYAALSNEGGDLDGEDNDYPEWIENPYRKDN